jgi:hypothetical protein
MNLMTVVFVVIVMVAVFLFNGAAADRLAV